MVLKEPMKNPTARKDICLRAWVVMFNVMSAILHVKRVKK